MSLALNNETVRIIGGRWRGRKLHFPVLPGLRPSSDRLRETLFNWLMHDIPGTSCLDVFAGSGALGFEAISRGASSVVFLDMAAEAVKALRDNADRLSASEAMIYQDDALRFLRHTERRFDIIFLDPPFDSDFLSSALALIGDHDLLSEGGLIYIEYAKNDSPDLSAWQIKKEKVAGRVVYGLLARKSL